MDRKYIPQKREQKTRFELNRGKVCDVCGKPAPQRLLYSLPFVCDECKERMKQFYSDENADTSQKNQNFINEFENATTADADKIFKKIF